MKNKMINKITNNKKKRWNTNSKHFLTWIKDVNSNSKNLKKHLLWMMPKIYILKTTVEEVLISYQ